MRVTKNFIGVAKPLCRERQHESRHFNKMQMKNHGRDSFELGICSKFQRGGWFSREFETCQSQRTRIDMFCEHKHLKSAAEHFRMKQCLQLARHFRRRADFSYGRMTPIACGRFR
jgi:hypothetical protein